MSILQQIANLLEAGEDEQVSLLTAEAIERGIDASLILADGLIAGMNRVGKKFRGFEIFLPDVLLSAKAMKAGMGVIKPLLSGENIRNRGTIVLGTVAGDMHDIGKNLVGVMLEGAGFEVIDLGKDVAATQFIQAAREYGASVIGMSALLTTTMPVMKEVIDKLSAEGLGGSVRTVVGGAPVSARFAEEIGADASAYDAASAVERFEELLG